MLQGSADFTVKPVNMTALVQQWTEVHGAGRTADVSDTVAGHPHQIFLGPDGTAAETYSLTGMGHGQPVDPGSGEGQCGAAGAYFLDVGLCAALASPPPGTWTDPDAHTPRGAARARVVSSGGSGVLSGTDAPDGVPTGRRTARACRAASVMRTAGGARLRGP